MNMFSNKFSYSFRYGVIRLFLTAHSAHCSTLYIGFNIIDIIILYSLYVYLIPKYICGNRKRDMQTM